jgi:Tol biopolymer transport system component
MEGPQLFLVAYPEGRHRRMTSDSNMYVDADLTADGATLASLRATRVSNVWSVPSEGKGRPKQHTFNTTSANAVSSFVAGVDGTIAFSAATDHRTHIWTIGTEGRTPRQLTPGANGEFLFRALPSGELVIARTGEDFTAHIVIMSPDGGHARTIVPGTGEWVQDVSPDGMTLLYQRIDAPRELWSVPGAGGEPARVATNVYSDARISPDGRWVAYLTPPELEGTSPTTCVVVPIEAGEPIATFTWPTQSRAPKWTPDGKGLSFLASKDNVTNVFLQPVAGGPPRPLTRLTDSSIQGYVWSPDGKRLVLQRRIDNVSNLWSAGADGRVPEPITDFPTGAIFGIDISKDGKTLYFLYGSESSDIVLLNNFR